MSGKKTQKARSRHVKAEHAELTSVLDTPLPATADVAAAPAKAKAVPKIRLKSAAGEKQPRAAAVMKNGSDVLAAAVDAVLHHVETPPTPTPSRLANRLRPAPGQIARPLDSTAQPAEPTASVGGVTLDAKLTEPTRSPQIEPTPVDPAPPPRGAKPVSPPAPLPWNMPNFDTLAKNMGQFIELSGQATTAYVKAREAKGQEGGFSQDVSDAFKTFGQIAEYWLNDPARLLQAQTALSSQFMDLWASSLQRMTPSSAPTTPANGDLTAAKRVDDKRFADPEWRDNPFFDFIRKSYLLGTGWANDLVQGAESVDPATRDKARFYLRQISSAVSPSNFVGTNPELLRETLKQSGGNLVRGMAKLADDIKTSHGDLKVRQTDASKFELGVNMALTPGKVVFRNDLIELLQYAPQTETVLKRPLLIVPPWINKFYVLDLNPEKSFIRWAVQQGLTVFVISWVNPDHRHADKDFASYMEDGIVAALGVVEASTREHQVSIIGYCVGGTLLAVTLAYMAARGDERIASATFLTTQVDFEHAGDLKIFADEAQIAALETQMQSKGFLEGSSMSQAFNMLRPEDLIWPYLVDNYVKGKDPLPFDLLAWNSDATRMPAANHSFYLRNCYLENKLARGLMEVAGQRLDLSRVTIPIYNLATREDHIAPARSVFEGCKAFGGPVRFVLAGSGHIAGVVNPPSRAKYGFWLGPKATGDYAEWLEAAQHQPGTWWLDWAAWQTAQAPETVPAREPGGGVLDLLGDAPGTYVRVKG